MATKKEPLKTTEVEKAEPKANKVPKPKSATPSKTFGSFSDYGLVASEECAQLEITSVITNTTATFPAFLTNFSQNWSSDWSSDKVYGRNDPIATFQGTVRTIALSFDFPSPNIGAAQEALKQCSNLAAMLYPGYSSVNYKSGNKTVSLGKIISKSPLVKVKFANLVCDDSGKGLLGYIGSFDWAPALDAGMYGSGGDLYPKVISLSFDLTVLHQHELNQKQLVQASFPFKV